MEVTSRNFDWYWRQSSWWRGRRCAGKFAAGVEALSVLRSRVACALIVVSHGADGGCSSGVICQRGCKRCNVAVATGVALDTSSHRGKVCASSQRRTPLGCADFGLGPACLRRRGDFGFDAFAASGDVGARFCAGAAGGNIAGLDSPCFGDAFERNVRPPPRAGPIRYQKNRLNPQKIKKVLANQNKT